MKAANISSQFDTLRSFFTVERSLLIIFAAALILRFIFLDLKLYHHDETIHAWFSINLLNRGIFSYSYDPTFHGPFLYYVTAGMFGLFGGSDLVGRIIPSLLGSVTVLLVYPIYKLGYLNSRQTIAAALFIAISTSMVYFSRFLRNDIFLVFFTMVILVSLLYYFRDNSLKYVITASAAAGLGMCCKENMPIILGIFGIYILYLVYSGKLAVPEKWFRDIVVCIVIIGGLMTVFYSAFLANPMMVVTGPFSAVDHWLSMHGQQRLGGPFFIYIILFLLYELPVFILGILGMAGFVQYRRRRHAKKEAEEKAAYVSELSEEMLFEDTEYAVNAGYVKNAEEMRNTGESSLISRILKAVTPPDVLKAPVDKNYEFTKFCIFWMGVSLIAYAYLGEKVPWLLLHQLLPMIFVAVFNFDRIKTVITILGIVFFAVMIAHTSYNPDDIPEPIVQVQNSEDLRTILGFMDNSTKTAISNNVRWPFVWYAMPNVPQKVYYYADKYNPNVGPENYDLIITHDGENIQSIPGFDKYTCKCNYWIDTYDLVRSAKLKIGSPGYWEEVLGDIVRIGRYYFTRDAKLGSLNIDVFVKRTE